MATSSDATSEPEHKHRLGWFSKLPSLRRKLSRRRSNRYSTSAIADVKDTAPSRPVRASSESPPPPSRARAITPKNETAGQPGRSVAVPSRTPSRQARTPPRQTRTPPRQTTLPPSPPSSVPVSAPPSGLLRLEQGEGPKPAAYWGSRAETLPELARFPVPPRSRPPSLVPPPRTTFESEKLVTESLVDEKLSPIPQVPKQSEKRQFRQPPTPSSTGSSVASRHRASSSIGSIPSTVGYTQPSPILADSAAHAMIPPDQRTAFSSCLHAQGETVAIQEVDVWELDGNHEPATRGAQGAGWAKGGVIC
jgi:hypothetical protein